MNNILVGFMSDKNEFNVYVDEDFEDEGPDEMPVGHWPSSTDELVVTLMKSLQDPFGDAFKIEISDFSDINVVMEATRVRLLTEMKSSVLPLQMFMLSNAAGCFASLSFDTGLTDSPANMMFSSVITRVLASGVVPAYVLLLSFWRAKVSEVAPRGYRIMNAADAVSREEVMVMIGCNASQRVVKTFRLGRDAAESVIAMEEAAMHPPLEGLSLTSNLFDSISDLEDDQIPRVTVERVLH